MLVNQSLLTWLGADPAIFDNASAYFLVFTLSLPILQLNSLCSSMLQCSGNMKIPSLLNASMCGLDVIYNLISFITLVLWGQPLEQRLLS